MSEPNFKDQILPRCEFVTRWKQRGGIATFCGEPTAFWHPAMDGGTMALCAEHGAKRFPNAAQRAQDPIWHGGGEPSDNSNSTSASRGAENV